MHTEIYISKMGVRKITGRSSFKLLTTKLSKPKRRDLSGCNRSSFCFRVWWDFFVCVWLLEKSSPHCCAPILWRKVIRTSQHVNTKLWIKNRATIDRVVEGWVVRRSYSNINDTHTQHTRRHTHKPSAAELFSSSTQCWKYNATFSRLSSNTQLSLALGIKQLGSSPSWPELSARQTGFFSFVFERGDCFFTKQLQDDGDIREKIKPQNVSRYFSKICVVCILLCARLPCSRLFEKYVKHFKPYFLIDFAVWNLMASDETLHMVFNVSLFLFSSLSSSFFFFSFFLMAVIK